VVVATLAAVWAFAPASRDDTHTPLDPVGALLSLIGLSSLIFGIIEGPEDGWTSGPVLAAFLLAGAVLASFVAWERRSDHPMLPLTLFRDRRFSTGSGVITVSFFVMFGFFFLITQYLQFARGYSALEAGLAGLPASLAFLVFSPRSAALVDRYGPARVMALGLAVVAGAFGLLTTLTTDTPYLVIGVAFALLGAGMSITAAPATSEIMTSVPLSKAGVGSAVNDTTRELGGALGIALLGSIANAAYRSGIDLAGTELPASTRAAAAESVGAAASVADRVPGGDQVLTQAASAFTDAFTLTNRVALAIALTAAAAVLTVLRPRAGEPAADEAGEDVDGFDLALEPAGVSADARE
jgi:Na+/melibiose symporter-like transporter